VSNPLPSPLLQFTPEEKDEIIGAMRTETKAQGLVDTNDNCWRVFIQRASRGPVLLTMEAAVSWGACRVTSILYCNLPVHLYA